MPKLRQQVAVQSFFIACGIVDYGEGHKAILATAMHYGAAYLPTARFDELRDWIASALVEGITDAEPRVDAMEAEIERQAIEDPVAHYESIAASSKEPEKMRWAFAAISPEYRAHLLAVRRARP
jgi:hypothetical protein